MTVQQQAFTRVRDRMAMLMRERGTAAHSHGTPPIDAMIGRIGQAIKRYQSA